MDHNYCQKCKTTYSWHINDEKEEKTKKMKREVSRWFLGRKYDFELASKRYFRNKAVFSFIREKIHKK